MTVEAVRDFELFNGPLKGKYIEGERYPHDRLAEKWPDAFEKVEETDSADSGGEG